MPPKTRITKEMILQAAFEIAQTEGAESINARTVSQKLGCSTQPVMYHFKTIEELKRAVYEMVDQYHSEYISEICSNDPMKDIGMNYIRFGVKEKNLFRFLFQSNEFSGRNILELTDFKPIIEILSKEAELTEEQAKTVFRSLFLCVHGYASMFANNDLDYDEESISADLDSILFGSICALKGGIQ